MKIFDSLTEEIDYYRIYDNMQVNNVMLTYKGELSFELINSIINTVDSQLEIVEENQKIRKKVYNVLVESLQNLFNHIEKVREQGIGEKSGLLIVSMNGLNYQIVTGNIISNDRINKLKNWIDEINSNDPTQLRTLYRQILEKEKFSEKGGAGLGLIDMARKSGQKLTYLFNEINEQASFFTLKITIPKLHNSNN